MIGLTWGEQLELSRTQWAAVCWNTTAFLLWYFVDACHIIPLWAVVVVVFSIGVIPFFDKPVSIDSRLFVSQSLSLEGITWSKFLENYYERPYLEWQSPYIPFIIAKCANQTKFIGVGTSMIGLSASLLMVALFGNSAVLLLSMPVTFLLMVQPSTDLPMIFFLVCSLLCLQHGNIILFSIAFAASAMIKPLSLSVLPFLILINPGAMMSVFFIAIAFFVSFFVNPQGMRQQIDLILSNLYIRRLPILRECSRKYCQKYHKKPITWWGWVIKQVNWRGKNIIFPMLKSSWFYFGIVLLFPSIQWQGVAFFLSLTILYSNVKYLWLAVLLCLPL